MFMRNQIESLSLRKLIFTLKIFDASILNYNPEFEVVVYNRNSDEEFSLPLNYKIKKRIGSDAFVKFSARHHQNFDTFLMNSEDATLDFYIHEKHKDITSRLGRPTRKAKLLMRTYKIHDKNTVRTIQPYLTFKKKNLSIDIRRFSKKDYQLIKWYMLVSPFLRLLHSNRNIWIIGELPYKAQDTGYEFFKFLRQEKKMDDVYYVMDCSSKEFSHVQSLGNVVDYKSIEHVKLILIAKKIFSSHHPDYLFPLKTKKFIKNITATRYFLQHGILGTKNMTNLYGKNASDFKTDYVFVSSDLEKEIFVKDLNYDSEQIYVTGLSRYDSLFKMDNVQLKSNVILVIPTWRDWILNTEDLLRSDFYKNYKTLLNDLSALAKEKGLLIKFCLHPNFQKFAPYFKDEFVQIINQGDVKVQTLLQESTLMITDYSSVGFDFSFLEKPVLYFQFDRDEFLNPNGSHLDLENDLPGIICKTHEEVLANFIEYLHSDFLVSEDQSLKSKQFLKYYDTDACQRILNVANNT